MNRDAARHRGGSDLNHSDGSATIPAEAMYRLLAEQSTDMLSRHARNGAYLYASPASREIFGYRPLELVGKDAYDFFHPDDVDRVECIHATILDTNATTRVSYRLRHKKGHFVWVETTAKSIQDDSGAVREIIASTRSIEGRKRAEKRHARSLLKQASLLRSLGEVVYERPLAHEDLRWTDCPGHPLGYEPDEVGPELAAWLSVVHEDDRDGVASAYKRCASELSPLEIEYRAHRKDGSQVWLLDQAIIHHDRHGAPKSLLGIVRDVTERCTAQEDVHRLNQDLQSRSAALESVNQELQAFCYSVSHDLRAPLRAMDGFSLALLEDCGDRLDDRGRDYLRRIRGASQRMAQLIDELLRLSRITRADLRMVPIDFSALAESVVSEASTTFSTTRDVRIQQRLRTRGDELLLKIGLTNLIENAFKFTRGVEHPRIEIGSEKTAQGSAFFVRDNGAGFDQAYAHKLFVAFQRLHSESEFEGTGIGLATVKRIVHRHGGRIWGESEPGRGATFYFTLPMERRSARRVSVTEQEASQWL